MEHELAKCPMCGGSQGYTLHDGSTYRWWLVQCKDCGRDVSECRSDGSTHLNAPKPERWEAADESWNDAGAYASSLEAEVARLLEALDGAYALSIGWAAHYQHNHSLQAIHPMHQEILDECKELLSKRWSALEAEGS